MAYVRLREVIQHLFSRENRWALALALMLLVLVILTADSSPLWIYQGF